MQDLNDEEPKMITPKLFFKAQDTYSNQDVVDIKQQQQNTSEIDELIESLKQGHKILKKDMGTSDE